MIGKEQWQEWRDNPVTVEFFRFMDDLHQDRVTAWEELMRGADLEDSKVKRAHYVLCAEMDLIDRLKQVDFDDEENNPS